MKKLIILLVLLTSQLVSHAQKVNANAVPFKSISKKDCRFLIKKLGDFIQEEPDSADVASIQQLIELKKFVSSTTQQTASFANAPAPFIRYMMRNVYRNDVVNFRIEKDGYSSLRMQQEMIDRMTEQKNKEQNKEESAKNIQCQILSSANIPCPYAKTQ